MDVCTGSIARCSVCCRGTSVCLLSQLWRASCRAGSLGSVCFRASCLAAFSGRLGILWALQSQASLHMCQHSVGGFWFAACVTIPLAAFGLPRRPTLAVRRPASVWLASVCRRKTQHSFAYMALSVVLDALGMTVCNQQQTWQHPQRQQRYAPLGARFICECEIAAAAAAARHCVVVSLGCRGAPVTKHDCLQPSSAFPPFCLPCLYLVCLCVCVSMGSTAMLPVGSRACWTADRVLRVGGSTKLLKAGAQRRSTASSHCSACCLQHPRALAGVVHPPPPVAPALSWFAGVWSLRLVTQ